MKIVYKITCVLKQFIKCYYLILCVYHLNKSTNFTLLKVKFCTIYTTNADVVNIYFLKT